MRVRRSWMSTGQRNELWRRWRDGESLSDIAEERAVPGQWEGDLLEGRQGTYLATLVERQSRYALLIRLPNKETQTVVRALATARADYHTA